MAGVLISPKIDIKIRNREAAYRRKFGSPNFRDILRQRCRQRIKARRGKLFDNLRPLNSEDEVRSALSDMMLSDVKDITANKLLGNEVESMDITDIRTDSGYQELWIEYEEDENSNEEERYIMKIYEELLEREEATLTLLEDELFCPLCEKGIFNNNNNSGVLTCTQCPAVLHSTACPSQIKNLINSGLTTHDWFCSKRVNFAIFSEETMHGLFMICDTCAYFIQVV